MKIYIAGVRSAIMLVLICIVSACTHATDLEPVIESQKNASLTIQAIGVPDLEFADACSVSGECEIQPALTRFGQQVARAVYGDPQVMEGRSEIEGARAQLRSAKDERLPQFSIDAESTDISLSVRQPIWTGGRMSAQIAEANATLRQTAYTFLSTQQNVAFDVIDAYGKLVSSNESIRALEDTLQEHRELMLMIERRTAVRASDGGDGELVRARIARLEADLISSKGTMRLAKLELERQIDEEVNLDAVQAVMRRQIPLEHYRSEDITELVRDHAQIKASEAEVNRFEAMLEYAKANRFPIVSAVAQHRVASITSSNRASDNNIYLGVSTSFGPGVSHENRISAAAHGLDESRAQVITSVQEIERQIKSLLVLHSSAYELITIYQEVIEANKEILESYRRQMSEFGNKTWQDVAGILREINDAQQAVARNRADMFVAQAKLEIILYGLEGL